ncbi:MAG: hypothetical protein QN122_07405 [Armatimonadota bacterium]|nr:hypothetical protein [Armatimonadota bacterium]MDR7479480.1 hypothetical protein [Armatimonadota bacterium]MDR7488190.1 hypothetical protein [Armatimonadota bacterium]MDR7491262.1 hypothetical protein [Armatimonadota bacterium]MDR7503134.1 hypothetical protein [Armatimonadota bacterium]
MGGRSRRYRVAGLLLVALWAAGLARLDHHAAEADPLHEHLVLTTNGITWASSLPPHTHGAAAPHTHAPAGAPRREGGVTVVLATSPSTAVTVLGLAAGAVLEPAPGTPVWFSQPVASVVPPVPPTIHSLAWAPADPPPRPL